MEWKDIAHKVADAAPLIGTLLQGPAGAAVGSLIASTLGTPADARAVDAKLAADPQALAKIRDIEAQRQTVLQQLAVQAEANRLAADTAALQAVNATIQTEAKADHWPTYTWRPFIGFAFGATVWAGIVLVLGSLLALVVDVKQAAVIAGQVPAVLGALAALGATTLPVLGVASYFRGKAQADPTIPTDNRG